MEWSACWLNHWQAPALLLLFQVPVEAHEESDSDLEAVEDDREPERVEPEPSGAWDYTTVVFLFGIVAIAIAAGFALNAFQ